MHFNVFPIIDHDYWVTVFQKLPIHFRHPYPLPKDHLAKGVADVCRLPEVLSDTPVWAYRITTGACEYLLVPLNAVADLVQIISYTDDLGVLIYGLVMIAAFVKSDVRASARSTLKDWIGGEIELQLSRIDNLR